MEGEVSNIELISTDENIPDVEKKPKPIIKEPEPIVLASNEILLFDKPHKILKTFANPCELIGRKPYWLDDKAHAVCEPWVDVELKNGSIVYDVKELKNVLLFKLNPNDTKYYLSPEKHT